MICPNCGDVELYASDRGMYCAECTFTLDSDNLVQCKLPFIEPDRSFAIPKNFQYERYIEIEREVWALFPDVALQGKRVTVAQFGMSGFILAEIMDDGSELKNDETYVLMPCADYFMRFFRMKMMRRISTNEFRMVNLTSIRVAEYMVPLRDTLIFVQHMILGQDVIDEYLASKGGQQ